MAVPILPIQMLVVSRNTLTDIKTHPDITFNQISGHLMSLVKVTQNEPAHILITV